MIAVCPKCSARYRVDASRLGPEGAKLRCTKCSALFLVRAPLAPVQTAPTEPGPTSKTSSGTRAEPPSDPATSGSGRRVVVADPDEARGKASVEAIRGWGVEAHLVHDGVEAMLAIQRLLPQVVVLDAALPRMYGFQVCEVVKRNASLRHMQVALVGAVHDPSRDRRDPSDLYGADVCLEQPDLPDALLSFLQRCGLVAEGSREQRPAPGRSAAMREPVRSAPSIVPPTPAAPPPPPAASKRGEPTGAPATPASSPSAPADPARDEERERARRLARIAVSEMLLYQPDKFAQAVREGTLERVLDLEIQEARALLRQRISPEVRAEADFVLEELHRVARERSARA